MTDANYHREYYIKTKDRRLELRHISVAELRKRNRLYIKNYLKTHACVDCEESDPIVLEFDHLNNKKYNIGDMSSQGYSLKNIQKEIEKCEVRCANCHRRITNKRRVDMA